MAIDRQGAVEALERLGLSNYEAKVFIALQTLGHGTAREVYRVAEIPRSQVYGAAESLEEQGLVEIQQSSPIRYRPVSIEEARAILHERFEQEQERAFDYLETARERYDPEGEQREDVWSLQGREHVDARVEQLVNDAEATVLFGASTVELVREPIREALVERAANGVPVKVISENEAVHELFGDGIETYYPPEQDQSRHGGRLLVVDGDAVLLSVLTESESEDQEAAIWSEGTGLATVLATILANLFDEASGAVRSS
jgi:HTH-type transcriptional regulator, sugar sensing transcriptional regulator